MGEFFQKVSEKVQNHLTQLVKTAGLPQGEESLEVLAKGWLEKESSFSKAIAERHMVESEEIEVEDSNGALVLTYSGSLLNIGPLSEEGRRVEYTSIGLRRDVPESAVSDSAALAEKISVDAPVVFSVGPIQKSSPVYRIARVEEELNTEEEEELLAEVTQLLTEDFIEVNKTIISE